MNFKEFLTKIDRHAGWHLTFGILRDQDEQCPVIHVVNHCIDYGFEHNGDYEEAAQAIDLEYDEDEIHINSLVDNIVSISDHEPQEIIMSTHELLLRKQLLAATGIES